MALHQYIVDLGDYQDAEFDKVYELLNSWAFTGLKLVKTPRVFSFFLDEGDDIRQIVDLPDDKIRRIQ